MNPLRKTIFGKIMRELLKRPRIRALPEHFVTPFDVTTLDTDTLLVLRAIRARDPEYVRALESLYHARGADLLKRLPRLRRPSLRDRLMTLMRRLEGTQPTRPSEFRRPSGAAKARIHVDYHYGG